MKTLTIFLLAMVFSSIAYAAPKTKHEWDKDYICWTGNGNWFQRGWCPATPIPWHQLAKGPGEGDNPASANPPSISEPVEPDRPERCK